MGDVTLISPLSFWSIKSIPAKKIFSFFKSFAKIFDIFFSVVVSFVLIALPPLLKLLKKEPFLGILEIAPTIFPLMIKTLLSPLFILGKNFFLGFSPERENPGDKSFSYNSTPKVISGFSKQCLSIGYFLYKEICKKVYIILSLLKYLKWKI